MNVLPKYGYRAAGVALLALVAVAGCAKPSPAGGPTPSESSTRSVTTHPACTPHTPPGPGAPALAGPALTALTGGAARQAFSLDSGALAVNPPRPGDTPAVTAAEATCDAPASIGANDAFGDFTGGGMATGYARVTIRPDLLGDSQPFTGDGTSVLPELSSPAAYQDRLAWVVVVRRVLVAACPFRSSGSRSAPPPRKTDYGYDVFLLDAATGGAALDYTEGGPDICGGPGRYPPTTTVPVDQVSVPWTLVSRDKNGYSGTVRADMTSCDGYDTVASPDEDTPGYLQVVVQRPIGSSCAAVHRTLTVDAATVTADLPAKLTHAPTGLVLPGTPPPSVLGPLGGLDTGPVVELRAWHRGTATLTVPARLDGEPATCASPWTMHVTVR